MCPSPGHGHSPPVIEAVKFVTTPAKGKRIILTDNEAANSILETGAYSSRACSIPVAILSDWWFTEAEESFLQ